MNAAEALGSGDVPGHGRDGDRGCVAGDDAVIPDNPAEFLIDLLLDLDVLEDRLDDDVGLFGVIRVFRNGREP